MFYGTVGEANKNVLVMEIKGFQCMVKLLESSNSCILYSLNSAERVFINSVHSFSTITHSGLFTDVLNFLLIVRSWRNKVSLISHSKFPVIGKLYHMTPSIVMKTWFECINTWHHTDKFRLWLSFQSSKIIILSDANIFFVQNYYFTKDTCTIIWPGHKEIDLFYQMTYI